MERNGPCLPLHQQSVYSMASESSTVRETRRNSRNHSAISQTLSTSINFSVLVIAILFLNQPMPTESLSPVCPQHCLCSNMTTTIDVRLRPTFIIDCSNGNLQSFIATLSNERHHATNDNITKENSQSSYEKNKDSLSSNPDTLKNVLPQQMSNETLPRLFYGDHLSTNYPLPDINLDLSFNNVSSLSALELYGWESAHMVKMLNLSNNLIEKLNASHFHLFTNLVILDLSNNVISAFTPDVFQYLPSLKYLYLHDNRIAYIVLPQQHTGDKLFISNLVHLDLSHNSLLSLPSNAFSAFTKLSNLNLTQNTITVVNQSAFMGLTHLRSLHLSQNNISNMDYPVFQNTSLVSLWLDNLPQLSYLGHNVFQGLTHLKYLNLSHNSKMSFLHHDILSGLPSLQILDLSGDPIQKLSSLTFRNNHQLHTVNLKNVPLSCLCTNAWLVEHLLKNTSYLSNVSSLQCVDIQRNKTLPIAEANFTCNNLSMPIQEKTLSVAIGSTLTLQCKQALSLSEDILIWTTPRGHIYHYHHFHPNASKHLLSPKDVQPHAPFHKTHFWHQSSSYNSDLSSSSERILVLSDGSLFIDYVLRTDAGSYSCVLKNSYANVSGAITVHFSYNISGEVKIIACIVGILCALGFFTLNVVYVVISWLARRLINKRRREHIRQMLENLNSYKSTQITRIYENYTGQLTRVRNRYHVQRDRLHKNYTMQVERVKRGCSHQVEKVRDNYNNRLIKLREYSSSQIMQIREMATNQIGRIRDYGSLQLDRLRETYKLQHQHMMKLLDTMNLDNCRSIVETECMRTESLMYDLDLLSQEDVRIDSPFSMADADSEYNTATSSPLLSVGSQDLIDTSTHQIRQNDGDHEYGMVGEKDAYFSVGESVTELEEILTVSKSKIRDTPGDASDHETGDDIHIEMNTVLCLPENVRLDAREVWTYGKGDESTHTLYTKIQAPKGSQQTDTERKEQLAVTINDSPHEGETTKDETGKTVNGVALPSIDMSMVQQPGWNGVFMEQEASPVKVWQGPPPLFHCDSCEDSTIVHLYDGDVEENEEDEEDEKTEKDTMM